MKIFTGRSILFTLFLTFTIQTAHSQSIARFYTSQGDFDVELREDLVPITAGNFIDLCNQEFYDFVIWHRVVPGFVIQSGDPTGLGTGGPGYTIPDEFHPSLTHNSKGILSMANSGPNTGGSQFFITLAPASHLNNLHSVFGEVIAGINVVDLIAATPLNGNGTPVFPPVNDSIRVISTATNLDKPISETRAALGGNFPNPFSGETMITFGLMDAGEASILIFDATGRLVRTMDAGYLDAGDHRLIWDAKDGAGQDVNGGLYFYQLHALGRIDSKPMILVR
jgi:peptidyl-prolyl cis-trans isomerase A (cyclophilin A)